VRPGKLVYQEFGERCPSCGLIHCTCSPPAPPPTPAQQTARLLLERKGRGGKTVTLIQGLVHTENEFKTLTQKVKQHCGSGGAYKEGTIEIQGDHRDRLAIYLQSLGYRIRKVGG